MQILVKVVVRHTGYNMRTEIKGQLKKPEIKGKSSSAEKKAASWLNPGAAVFVPLNERLTLPTITPSFWWPAEVDNFFGKFSGNEGGVAGAVDYHVSEKFSDDDGGVAVAMVVQSQVKEEEEVFEVAEVLDESEKKGSRRRGALVPMPLRSTLSTIV